MESNCKISLEKIWKKRWFSPQNPSALQIPMGIHNPPGNGFRYRLAAAQQADKTKELLDHSTLLGVQATYYYNTIVGPVGASLGYSNRTKKPYFYLNLGYEF